jgi:hypothetical protein
VRRESFLKGALAGGLAAAAVTAAAAAVAGTGVGGVFNLGQTNSVNAPSALTGGAAGYELGISNTSTDPLARAVVAYGVSPTSAAGVFRNLGGGPALTLQVSNGVPPFTVTSAARVANLNADLLDRIDSTDLLQGTGQTTSGAVTIQPGSSQLIFQPFGGVQVIYVCPSALTDQGSFYVGNTGSSPVTFFIDSGGPNPVYHVLGGQTNYGPFPAAASGDSWLIQAALSVRSQLKSRSSRPKWPYAAVFA